MSNQVILRPHNFIPYTLMPNFFIDGFLPKANGEFVKVYLVLLRYMSVGQLDFTLGRIADHLLMTESDILRALRYFQQEGLLSLTYENNELREIHLVHLEPTGPETPHNRNQEFQQDYHADYQNENYNPSQQSQRTGESPNNYNYEPQYTTPQYPPGNNYNHYNQDMEQERQPLPTSRDSFHGKNDSGHLKVISSKPDYTNKEIATFAERDDFHQLLYITQKYLSKTLSSNEVKTIIGFHDWLGLPIDVVELLIEYCVDNDHRNMRYIEKVAIDWADNGINTIEKAKVRTETYQKSYFVILKAYGITDRSPTPNQIQLMDKWLNDYQFDMSIIIEACERTIAQINKAEMRYTDSILNTWFKESVKTIDDIRQLDAKRPTKQTYSKANNKKNNSFNSYNQRNYDYDELEKKALEMRLRDSGKRYSS